MGLFCVVRTLKGEIIMEKAIALFDTIVERTSAPIRKIHFLFYCMFSGLFFTLAFLNRGYENFSTFTFYFFLAWVFLIRPKSVLIRIWTDGKLK